jgi:feruloyl esterase
MTVCLGTVFLWSALNVAVSSAADTTAINDAKSRCEALAGADFTDVKDAPTQVVAAKFAEPEGIAAYCQVQGYIAPQIGFELRMPVSDWNGKFMEVGCGGWCGTIIIGACDGPLRRGYACIASDMGRKGTGFDVLWSHNNWQAQIDFGYRATHVTALAGKAIAQHFFRRAPARSYFVGCSTGGYQGVTEAQRFPWDFDGIIAGAPDIDESGANLRALWIAKTALNGQDKLALSYAALKVLHAAALHRCDLDDGLKDAIIGNSHACRVDPGELICKTGRQTDCLTPAEAETARKLYAGPTSSSGESVSTGGLPPGSELLWGWIWPAFGIEQYFKYGIPGYSTDSRWKYTDFDFDRDYRRFGLAAHYDNSNPDLRKFKNAGGKLVVYHGGSNTVDLPGPVIDYYDTVEKTMGGRSATQAFFRLFVVPGMNHCTGGDGPYAIDYLDALESWVEHGRAPDQLARTSTIAILPSTGVFMTILRRVPKSEHGSPRSLSRCHSIPRFR